MPSSGRSRMEVTLLFVSLSPRASWSPQHRALAAEPSLGRKAETPVVLLAAPWLGRGVWGVSKAISSVLALLRHQPECRAVSRDMEGLGMPRAGAGAGKGLSLEQRRLRGPLWLCTAPARRGQPGGVRLCSREQGKSSPVPELTQSAASLLLADFDEQTADDWDVDMSIYYDKDGGDKDARDSVQMWLEQRLRAGLEEGSVSGQHIGTFERHTKGFGRKVLEQQGWTEGLGLGSSNSGMAEALDNEGQNPRCKRGLGYHGEKLPTFVRRKKPRGDSSVVISTIYDEPEPQDMGDQLLRRQPLTAMKYRQDMAFVRASQPALGSLRAQPR
uniref:Uncharacterized protein n=1 Tax=Geospiza parvula TaxID=87175 RepID=A0A8C3MGN7_GEOPR